MKKKIIIFLIIVSVLAFFGYKYIYQSHRDISSETASFSIKVEQLKKDFSSNDSVANAKYLDKTIVIYGEVTNVDLENKQLIIDSSLNAKMTSDISAIKVKDKVTLKGRFIGYNDLLEEFEMDQCTIEKE
ncbi:hypothetical protein [Flavobacterium sp.]|uniref:OB-fold protein n=1 Tax=Flavobacterium sp. TaxID=239 RepID=UPI00262895CA|nr:hypothetical protein [Flavobacterium sp.]